jgi:hypothetical protein
MLFAVDLHEHFIDIEGVAITAMLAFQSLRVESTKLDAPQSDGFVADCDASFSKEVFDIAVAEVEAAIEPNSIGNDIWRKSVALVCIHSPILPISGT